MTIVVTHNQADFDALAAMIAATKIYPGSCALAPERMHPDVALFMKKYGDQLTLGRAAEAGDDPVAAAAADVDVVVVVDSRRRRDFGRLLPLLERARRVHIYDHHPPSPDDLEGNEIRVEPLGAVTTLLLEEIFRRRITLNELERTLMLLGIYRDTASLSGANTTPRDAAAAASLWEQGVDAALIEEFMRPRPAAQRESLLLSLLEASELYEVCRRRILIATASAGEQIRGLGALTRRLQQMEGVDLAMAIMALPRGGLHLSARTIADDLDLPLLLAPLGARGCRRAVSAQIKDESPVAFKERLLEFLERYLPPAATALQIAAAPVATVDAAWTVAEAGEFLDAGGHGGAPVVEGGRVAGMIGRREISKAMRSGFGDSPVRGFMRQPAVTASPQDSVTALRRSFVENRTERIILAGDGGEPLGMVAPMDILHHLYRLDGSTGPPAARGGLLRADSGPPPTGVENMGPLIQERLPPRLQSRLLLMGQRAAATGASVYLVGGVVRDLLLGKGPPRDLDFVVIPDAPAFAGEMARLLGGRLKVFEHFGTASLFLQGGLRLDFATARREIYAAPAALPQVEGIGNLKNDLFRRDFTINTLACSLLPESYGKLYDFFGGREDLERGVIRTLYHLSFVDDPLRLLRAVRFEQRFSFRIDGETLTLMEKALRSGVLEKVTRQRLAQEMGLIYTEADPPALLMRLHELKILEQLYPALAPDHLCWQRLNRVGEALAWADGREWSKAPEKELVYLGGLLLGMEPQDQTALLRRLGLSRRRAGAVLQGCRDVPPLLEELSGEGAALRPSRLANRLDPLVPEALLLLYALAGGGALRDQIGLYLESLQYVRPRLRGGALKKLGLQPGPLFAEILEALRRAVLDGELRSYDEELDFVISYLEGRKEE